MRTRKEVISLALFFKISCDRCGAVHEHSASRETTIGQCLNVLLNLGEEDKRWTFVEGKHYCPKCRLKILEATRKENT